MYKLYIWLPLRPYASWRGEGIAQTIERLVSGINKEFKVTIICQEAHAKYIEENLHDKDNIYFWKIRIREFDPRIFYSINPVSRITKSIFSLIINFFVNFKWLAYTVFYYLRLRVIRNSNKIVWTPVWATLLSEKKFNAKKICNFWDGFVFEYRQFEDSREIILSLLTKFLATTDKIITQSQANKSYLTQVLGFEEKKIKVIYNPHPSYSHLIDKVLLNKINQNKKEALNYWKPEITENFWRENHKLVGAKVQKKYRDFFNKSLFSRMIQSSDSKTKFFFISSQNRAYKGFKQLFYSLNEFSKLTSSNFTLITTGSLSNEELHLSENYNWAFKNVYEFKKVNDFNHALLYSVSDLVIHSSFAEGGLGVFPLFEAASINKLCLMNEGTHTKELLECYPFLNDLCVDFNFPDIVADKMLYFLNNDKKRNEYISYIQKIIEEKNNSIQDYKNYFIEEFKN